MKPIEDRIRQLRSLCNGNGWSPAEGARCGAILADLLGSQTPPLNARQAAEVAEVAVGHFTTTGGCSDCPSQVGKLPAQVRARVEREGARRGASPVAALAKLREAAGPGTIPAPLPDCAACGAEMERRIGSPDPLVLEHGAILCSDCLNVQTSRSIDHG